MLTMSSSATLTDNRKMTTKIWCNNNFANFCQEFGHTKKLYTYSSQHHTSMSSNLKVTNIGHKLFENSISLIHVALLFFPELIFLQSVSWNEDQPLSQSYAEHSNSFFGGHLTSHSNWFCATRLQSRTNLFTFWKTEMSSAKCMLELLLQAWWLIRIYDYSVDNCYMPDNTSSIQVVSKTKSEE